MLNHTLFSQCSTNNNFGIPDAKHQKRKSKKHTKNTTTPATTAALKPAPPPIDDAEYERRINNAKNHFAPTITPITATEMVWRHEDWLDKRDAVYLAHVAVGTSQHKLDAFQHCGSECTIEWSDTAQDYRCRARHCKNRHCEPCKRARANRLAANLKKKLEQNTPMKYRFITLTLKHTDTPLADQIKRLYKAFRHLRGQNIWKKTQHGGAFFLEVKWDSKTRRWHPHLHVVSEGDWMRQKDLSSAWHDATGDSHIVDIRALKDGHDAAHYVAKYVAKGTSDNVWTDTDAAEEWILATKGVRICATFGKWRGFKLMELQIIATDWKPICTLVQLAEAVARKEEWALGVMLAIRPPGKKDEVNKRKESKSD
jgi:Replication protein